MIPWTTLPNRHMVLLVFMSLPVLTQGLPPGRTHSWFIESVPILRMKEVRLKIVAICSELLNM